MKIAVHGASGYTGRLVVAELARRGVDAVLVGRDPARLHPTAAGTGFEVRIADFRDMVPAMTDDGGPSELISHLVGDATGPVERLTVALWYRGSGFSRGTLRSLDPARLFDGALRYENGGWTTYGEASRTTWCFPCEDAPVRVDKAALPPVATVPRHVPVGCMEGLLGGSFDALKDAVTPAVIDALSEGPTYEQRQQGRWTIAAEASGQGGRTMRGEVEGTDGYGKTAVIAVEAVRRLVADGAKAGVLAPSQAFDPESFLDFLYGHGVRWRVTDSPASSWPSW